MHFMQQFFLKLLMQQAEQHWSQLITFTQQSRSIQILSRGKKTCTVHSFRCNLLLLSFCTSMFGSTHSISFHIFILHRLSCEYLACLCRARESSQK